MVKIIINEIEMNHTEKEILDLLIDKNRPLTAFQICNEIMKTWHYTMHVLRVLFNRGLVMKNRKGQYYVQEPVKKILQKDK